MGIPSYFSHIVRQHRKIIKPINFNDSPKINNLYLDCNSFIYEAHQRLAQNNKKIISLDVRDTLLYESNIINEVCKSLVNFIQLLKPNKRLLIAFDGVAPLAKLNQQRNRRYMSAFQSSLDDKLIKDKSAAFRWNTSSITPGTNFMSDLSATIKAKFIQPLLFGLDVIVVSTSDEPGEGEHKIYEYIRSEAAYHKETYTVIYGLDADLIMLTLNHLHISENLYLFRETPEFIKNLDKTLNPNETYLLDIPLFAKSIIQELSNDAVQSAGLQSAGLQSAGLQSADKNAGSNDVLFDYILLCFFLGNDFLPHFPALNIRTNGIDRLILAYKHVFAGAKNETLTKNREIVWKNLRKYIDYLAANELTYIKEEYVNREKSSKYALSGNGDANLLLPLQERQIELFINPNESGWETRYYKTLFELRIDDDRRREISINYLEGLEWTMKYYSTGCADWRWTYNYYYPPLLADLIKHVPYFAHTFVPFKPANPVSQLVQLSYVLPPSGMDLLPAALKNKLLKSEPAWYVGNYTFLWAFCKFFWEAHVEMPKIDIKRLEEIVEG